MATLSDDYRTGSRIPAQGRPKSGISLYVAVFLLAAGFLILVAFILAFSTSANGFSLFGGKCVGVVTISQEITTEGLKPSLLREGQAGSEEIADTIYRLNKRDDIAGVLFVINSPGGSVVATREIYSAIKELKKPKVAYFREVAASGGYYIAAPMDYIMSDPDALTGSIGVVTTIADMSGLFEKVGINMTSIKSGEHKDIGSPARPMTDTERQILQNITSEVFEEFKSIITENRRKRLNSERFEEILDARILTGRQAKEVGLVDELGSKRDAIKKAAELSGLPKDQEPPLCEITIGESGGGLFGMEGAFGGLFPSNSRLSLKFE